MLFSDSCTTTVDLDKIRKMKYPVLSRSDVEGPLKERDALFHWVLNGAEYVDLSILSELARKTRQGE